MGLGVLILDKGDWLLPEDGPGAVNGMNNNNVSIPNNGDFWICKNAGCINDGSGNADGYGGESNHGCGFGDGS